jgi:hypothetical protein
LYENKRENLLSKYIYTCVYRMQEKLFSIISSWLGFKIYYSLVAIKTELPYI